MYKYKVILTWSEVDQIFVADVPELLGCMAHGASPEKALRSVNEAIKFWIDTATEIGKPVPKPKDLEVEIAE